MTANHDILLKDIARIFVTYYEEINVTWRGHQAYNRHSNSGHVILHNLSEEQLLLEQYGEAIVTKIDCSYDGIQMVMNIELI